MHAQPLYIESKMKTKPCEINKAGQSPDRVFLSTGNTRRVFMRDTPDGAVKQLANRKFLFIYNSLSPDRESISLRSWRVV
jgi:hypothetical protein